MLHSWHIGPWLIERKWQYRARDRQEAGSRSGIAGGNAYPLKHTSDIFHNARKNGSVGESRDVFRF
jgi:hypothetical protein